MSASIHRRGVLKRIAALGLACTGAVTTVRAQQDTVRIAVDVRKFTFVPLEIQVRLNQRVTFALNTTDFVHGFALPDFDARVDVVPGKLTELTIVANKVGKFHMLCDNFCGEDHDKMSGWLMVAGA
jgi:cytochrome c oxidase subunit 2